MSPGHWAGAGDSERTGQQMRSPREEGLWFRAQVRSGAQLTGGTQRPVGGSDSS